LAGAAAVARALEQTVSIPARVRWPNDVTYEKKKLAGVLCVSKIKGSELRYVLLGLGLNANFDSALVRPANPMAVSLSDVIGRSIDREELICSILLELERTCGDLWSHGFERIVPLIDHYDCSRGQRISVRLADRTLTGVFRDYLNATEVLVQEGDRNFKIEVGSVIMAEYVDG